MGISLTAACVFWDVSLMSNLKLVLIWNVSGKFIVHCEDSIEIESRFEKRSK